MTALTITEALSNFEAAGIPTHSFVAAAQHVNDLMLNTPQAQDRLKELTGEQVDGDHVMRVPLVYGYLVQNIIKAKLAKQSAELLDLLVRSKEQADTLIEKQSWMFIADEAARQDIENADPEVVIAGKAKKGARKALASKIYHAEIKDQFEAGELTRKEAIAIFMEKCGCPASGASTYFHNFKSGKWT